MTDTSKTEASGPPSLRIAEMAVTNFRVFRERTVIPFRRSSGQVDRIAVFHGDNGSGKSTALVALDRFLRSSVAWMASYDGDSRREAMLPWGELIAGRPGTGLPHRDRPADAAGPTDIEVQFEDSRLGRLRLRFVPSGRDVVVRLERIEGADARLIRGKEAATLRTWIETPAGPTSLSLAVVTARRRAAWLQDMPSASLLPIPFAKELYRLRSSLDPYERNAWRSFATILDGFPTFRGKEISIELRDPQGTPELIIEERGRSVLQFAELSSGEQQIVVLCAAVVTSRARIVAIEEPELSLDMANQALLKRVLEEHIASGFIDQFILESHVPSFDGPDVIRFRRAPSGVLVERSPATMPEQTLLAHAAKRNGAEERWVSRDGYTQLPKIMLDDLRMTQGGHLWFVRGSQGTWEAWPEDQLTALLGGDDEEKPG